MNFKFPLRQGWAPAENGWMGECIFKIQFCLCTLPRSPAEGDTVCKNIWRTHVEEEAVGLEGIPLWLIFFPSTSRRVSVATALWLLVRLVLLPQWIIKHVQTVKKMDGWRLWIPAESLLLYQHSYSGFTRREQRGNKGKVFHKSRNLVETFAMFTRRRGRGACGGVG